MSEQTGAQRPQGSRLAGMFGYVTKEDRSRWEQHRQAGRREGLLKSGSKQSLSSMMEFSQANMRAQLGAAHRVNEQRAFDETHDRVVTKEDGQQMTESISYEDRQTGDQLGPDMY